MTPIKKPQKPLKLSSSIKSRSTLRTRSLKPITYQCVVVTDLVTNKKTVHYVKRKHPTALRIRGF